MSKMLEEVKQAKEEANHTAQTGEGGNPDGQNEELPQGSSGVEESEETSEVEEEVAEEASGNDESEASAPPVAAAGKGNGKKVRIGEREFDSDEEAFKYAEELERKAESAELYNQGVRDALAANAGPAQEEAEPEDDFDARFYSNPKEALGRVKGEAVQEALKIIKAEQTRENLWAQFLEENPDIRRKDAERILAENAQTIGKMTDTVSAMKALARKTREEYAEIRDLGKPRTELKNSKTQAVSPSGGASKGVTPKKSETKPLSFIEEVRQNRRS